MLMYEMVGVLGISVAARGDDDEDGSRRLRAVHTVNDTASNSQSGWVLRGISEACAVFDAEGRNWPRLGVVPVDEVWHIRERVDEKLGDFFVLHATWVFVLVLHLEVENFSFKADVIGTDAGVVLAAQLRQDWLLSRRDFSIQFVLREQVSELQFECVIIVEPGDSLRALQVEPEDAVQVALTGHDAVLHGLLQQAVHVVLLEGLTFVGPLRGHLVEKVHHCFVLVSLRSNATLPIN